jgi:S1-C subfamily serine protease
LTSPEALSQALGALTVGSTLHLRVWRNGKFQTLTYALPDRPLLPGDLTDWQVYTSRIRRGVRLRAP